MICHIVTDCCGWKTAVAVNLQQLATPKRRHSCVKRNGTFPKFSKGNFRIIRMNSPTADSLVGPTSDLFSIWGMKRSLWRSWEMIFRICFLKGHACHSKLPAEIKNQSQAMASTYTRITCRYRYIWHWFLTCFNRSLFSFGACQFSTSSTCQSALLLKVLVVVVLAVLVLEALVVLVELMVDLGAQHSNVMKLPVVQTSGFLHKFWEDTPEAMGN